MYTQNYYKKIFLLPNIKQIFCPVNVRMINLSFDELRLIAQVRNINSYENKSKEDLIKALSEPKSESPKPEIPKSESSKLESQKPEIPNPKTPKPKTPKLISSKLKISKSKMPKPRPKPRSEIRVNKKIFKKLRKDFDELRHKLDKKEIDRYRKAFYNVKNNENLSVSKIKKASKSLNK